MYNFPLMFTDWTPLCPNNYTVPVLPTIPLPVAVIAPPIVSPACPFPSILVPDPVVPVISSVPLAVTPLVCNNICTHAYEPELYNTAKSISTEEDHPLSDVKYTEDVLEQVKEVDKPGDKKFVNNLEYFLRLPKDLFPTARMLTIDPNIVIDEFCKLASVKENVSWILDLEFGVPKVPITRVIAAYDVKFNSIHCKNTPGAIHPNFEKCNGDFKRAILFYYDCVVSNWYNGYVILKHDKSVENFQSWLQIPMQTFGMCWP